MKNALGWICSSLPLTKLLLKEDCKYIYIVGRSLLFSKSDKIQQEKLYRQEIYYCLTNKVLLSLSGERRGAMASRKQARAQKIDPMHVESSTLTGIHSDKEKYNHYYE